MQRCCMSSSRNCQARLPGCGFWRGSRRHRRGRSDARSDLLQVLIGVTKRRAAWEDTLEHGRSWQASRVGLRNGTHLRLESRICVRRHTCLWRLAGTLKSSVSGRVIAAELEVGMPSDVRDGLIPNSHSTSMAPRSGKADMSWSVDGEYSGGVATPT